MTKANLSEFLFDNISKVYLHPNRKDFSYTDGLETEERILAQLKNVNDVSIFSRELIAQIDSWPSEYHFSPLRHNLLRHYDFKTSHSILELGCGCGAITRQLGESGAQINAIEGSLLRATCAAERCRDLSNVKIYCSNFQDVAISGEYDFVTLIGVLEYSGIFFEGNKPFNQCLEIAKAALKKDGKLIIAIENRLGLKYFLGYSEDHTCKPYDGVQDFYEKDTACTFGKYEITNLLQESGFGNLNFAYPFPDYKLPEAIIFESAFNTSTFTTSNILRQTVSRDYSYPENKLPSEAFIWDQLEKNNLASDIANSFLIEASVNFTNHKSVTDANILAKFYTVNRKREFNTVTSFVRTDLTIEVVKRKLENYSSTSNVLSHSLDNSSNYFTGYSLEYFIAKAIAKNNFQEFTSYLTIWLDFIFKTGIKEQNAQNRFLSLLKDEYIDCKPSNVILSNGTLVLIDTEWKYNNAYCVYTVLFRYLMNIKLSFIDLHLVGHDVPIKKLFAHLNIYYSDSSYKEYESIENEISNVVYDGCYSIINGQYSSSTVLRENNTAGYKNILKKFVRLFRQVF